MSQPTVLQMTAVGRGAVASLRYQGDVRILEDPQPLFVAANKRPLSQQPPNRIVFGCWGTTAAEEIVVCRTGEQTLEIHCHGGEAAVERIKSDLAERGVVETTAFQSFEVEMDAALISAQTLKAATWLQRQRSGLLKTSIEEMLRLESVEEFSTAVDSMLKWSAFGIHLTRPWQVVIVGAPNVGKSSLINRILGYERSIVFDQPGTTRDVVSVRTAIDGWPVELSDTAGIRSTTDPLETQGIQRAKSLLQDADLQVVLYDVSRTPDPTEVLDISQFTDPVLVAHKSDQAQQNTLIPTGALPVSSLTGEGLEPLLQTIADRLVPVVPMSDQPMAVTGRQVGLLRSAKAALQAGNLRDARDTLAGFFVESGTGA